MFDREGFEKEKLENAIKQHNDADVNRKALDFIIAADKTGYTYQWTWLGLPVIQPPEDIALMQEIIWETKPDVIIETGIAWGGSIVLYASILELVGKGKVIGVDTVLPQENINAITNYSFGKRIHLLEGSSTDEKVFEEVKKLINPGDKVMVILDSNHTHEHVYNELNMYGPIVTEGMYVVVSDTIVEEIPNQTHRVRPWGQGCNPKTGLDQYLKEVKDFTLDNPINNKAMLSFARGGFALCNRN